ncbi:MAG: hypothetical protein QXF26_08990 [Candidatus Bathyarchaeia archaeon]
MFVASEAVGCRVVFAEVVEVSELMCFAVGTFSRFLDTIAKCGCDGGAVAGVSFAVYKALGNCSNADAGLSNTVEDCWQTVQGVCCF